MASHRANLGMPRTLSWSQTILLCIAPFLGVIALVHLTMWFQVLRSLENGNSEEHFRSTVRETPLDPEEYYVFLDVCLESHGWRKWNLFVSNDTSSFNTDTIQLQNYIGHGDFATEEVKIIKNATMMSTVVPNILKGTFLLSFNTHANNFHIIADFLLPIFSLSRKTKIHGVLIPEGCAECWKGQLQIQSLGLAMMNLTVLYPMEALISNMTPPVCFDRLILKRHTQGAYSIREGRFSKMWSLEIFQDFRDSMNNFFRERWSSMPQADNQKAINATTTRDAISVSHPKDIQTKTTHKKPVLSWMSRMSEGCKNRCITNEGDAVEQLSRYFDVNVLDFSKGLTTDQAMKYIRETDVFIGLHGAGLAYSAFLPDGAMLVELRSDYGTRMFLNMASSLDLPYYAMSLRGCVGPGTDDVYTLPPLLIRNMTEQLYSAYMYEKQKLTKVGVNISDGKCEFPQPVTPCGSLSSTDHARCYLHLEPNLNPTEWFQCAWHDWC